ncbi:single-stranded-DNA-specific exonuclease RecJ [uncultured Eubacterium sp.]|uniref:single-stranded-DNA-specific exonuclease RecJ n=1 Tax=uncultured Eubacterium sp. TaxID=165185 RepID=UPI0015AABAAD|nr:single-stranded-DNA-specific exonuclease RecJ [uncultured Eubacterium sp.]
MAFKKWVVRQADKEKASELSEKFNIDPFVAVLLVSRGIEKDVDVVNFLSDDFTMPSPYDFADMDEAVFAVFEAIENNEKICVYGDYDCDGVTSTALLTDFFKSLGADVCYYIPDRESEGYGMNMSAVDTIHSWGVSLIVTVDNGIAAFDEAEYIYSLGMSLVITDHHQLSDNKLPRAEAVVNPHRLDNTLSFKEFCGVAVAFMLAVAMSDDNYEQTVERYIDLVAIGTIADVMPLIYENRSFVKKGLIKLKNNPPAALRPLLNNGADRGITSTEVAFQICPRLNAMGRMGDAKRAVELLLCNDSSRATDVCNLLNEENSLRQTTEQQILHDAKRQIEADSSLASSPVIVVAGKNYHHGVIGIVSAHITEEYGKPSFVIGMGDDGVARGSARSVEGFNIFEALTACKDDLVQFGGHPLAAGITLSNDKINDFRQHINDYALNKYTVMPQPELELDFKLSPSYLSVDLVNSLLVLEPYGTGNHQAVFGVYKLTLLDVVALSEGKHIRLELQKKNSKIRAVKFSTPFDTFPYVKGDVLNLAVRIGKNAYKGRMYLSVQAVDVRLSDIDEDRYFQEKAVYERYLYNSAFTPSLYPDRDACVKVYKYIKQGKAPCFTGEDLYFRLQNYGLTYGQVMFALQAFVESGLVNADERIKATVSPNKVELEQTDILRELKGRMDSVTGN